MKKEMTSRQAFANTVRASHGWPDASISDADCCECEHLAWLAWDRAWTASAQTKDAEIRRMKDALTFVERWANYHAQKPGVTAAEALSCIQHYPEIEAITESYADGKVPETRDPYAEITALKAERDALRKDAERYRFVVGSTDHSMAKWHDCEGWYAIEEIDLDADMQAQAVQPCVTTK